MIHVLRRVIPSFKDFKCNSTLKLPSVIINEKDSAFDFAVEIQGRSTFLF